MELNPGIGLPSPKRTISDEEVLKRLVYTMVNEASRCLDEKVANEAGAVDIGMIKGTGFPPFHAGLLRYAEHVGLQNIVEDLNRFSKISSCQHLSPAPYLVRLAANGQTFY